MTLNDVSEADGFSEFLLSSPPKTLVTRNGLVDAAAVETFVLELDQARETIKRLNRRCQSAESGLAARIEPGDRTLGRVFANAAAVMYRERLEDVRACIVEAGSDHADGCADEANCTCGAAVLQQLLTIVDGGAR